MGSSGRRGSGIAADHEALGGTGLTVTEAMPVIDW